MSAWLVFSMMGIYPMAPIIPIYVLTFPEFEKITINVNKDIYGKSGMAIISDSDKEGNYEVKADKVFWKIPLFQIRS